MHQNHGLMVSEDDYQHNNLILRQKWIGDTGTQSVGGLQALLVKDW